MSERKVLNKYYPPDYDPTKLPKLGLTRERQYVIRTMAPFNMRCKACGEYIYKGKKFNARKETVHGEKYLGLHIFRFYIRCTRCVSEITFKTDLENTDYAIEHGAIRLFEAEKLARKEAEVEAQQRAEDELNPMKMLENRTKNSKREMEIIESLEEVRELNARHAAVDYDSMLQKYADLEEQRKKREEEEDEAFVKSIYGSDGHFVKRLHVSDEEDEDNEKIGSKNKAQKKSSSASEPSCTDTLTQASRGQVKKRSDNSWDRSVGVLSGKKSGLSTLKGALVRPKKKGTQPLGNVSVDKSADCSSFQGAANKREEDVVELNCSSSGQDDASQARLNAAVEVCAAIDKPQRTATQATSGLGLLGDYSDSNSDSNTD